MRLLLHIPILIVLVLMTYGSSGQGSGDVLNKGVPGNSSADLLRRAGRNVIGFNPDLVIILAGTNDLLNTGKMVPVSVLIRNLGQLTDTLLRRGIGVVLVSPPPVDTCYLFERHDPQKYDLSPLRKLQMASEAIDSLCLEKKLLFIDLLSHLAEQNIPLHDRDDVIRNMTNSETRDGVHFTVRWNDLIARYIYGKLTAFYSDLSKFRIICFGDSITYGVFMDGEGSSEGAIYPAPD